MKKDVVVSSFWSREVTGPTVQILRQLAQFSCDTIIGETRHVTSVTVTNKFAACHEIMNIRLLASS